MSSLKLWYIKLQQDVAFPLFKPSNTEQVLGPSNIFTTRSLKNVAVVNIRSIADQKKNYLPKEFVNQTSW